MGEEADLGDFPPTVIPLAPPPSVTDTVSELPWESAIGLGALWRTATQVTAHAEQVGASFLGCGVLRAACFALIAELLAVGSMAAALAVALIVTFPKQTIAALADPIFRQEVLSTILSAVVLLAVSLVLLHWLWTLATELGAYRNDLPRCVRVGLALSGYSCGWDLITSPFGVVMLLCTRGVRSIGPMLQSAVRAPRRCAVAHLEHGRGFSPQQRQAVFSFAAWLTGPVVLVLAGALLVVLVLAMA